MKHDTPLPSRVIGLQYEGAGSLPTVVLKGAGPLADEMLRQRRQLVDAPPLVHDAALLEALFRLPIDAEIGPELFHAVAAILVHVISVDALQQGDPANG
jgi:type III secretion system FlhB-like substrate exporter